MKKLILILLIFSIVSLIAKAPPEYTKAYELFNKKKYKQSEKIFRNFVEKEPEHFYAANCFYWLGMINLKQKDYLGALFDFEQVMTCSNEWKYSDAMIGVGSSYMKLKEYEKAKKTYERIKKLYPKDTKNVNESNKQLKILKKKLK
ncbi:MAG: tetratricopeptide repeat protein [Candidatus Delongbacteria bacterium]|nr:tetratricopeptide repeat protein [Candidatus Delongbacteria bacterium]